MPFFYTGCKETLKAEEITSDNSAVDSTNVIDTSFLESTPIESSKLDSVNSNSQKQDNSDNEETLSSQLAGRVRILKMLLEPKEDRYTGLGSVVNTLPYIFYFSIFNAFILICSSLLIKLFKPIINFQLIFIEILGFLFLFISKFWDWYNETLYGYWIAIVFTLFIILFDFVLISQRRNKSKTIN
ncbi:MAG: hypothetical protein LW842_13355 [Sphingobacteriales bacterium]|jgi:hypothetical protein|nr:hypothetical protein [Sphingobacteriales bacterium]